MMGEPVTLSEDQMKTLVEKLSEQLAPILKPPGDPPGTSGHVVTFSGGGGEGRPGYVRLGAERPLKARYSGPRYVGERNLGKEG